MQCESMIKAIFLLLLWAALPLRAAQAPESLLPLNTIAVATVPDMNTARTLFKADPMVQLWNDPSMEAFTDRFEKAFRKNVMQRIRNEAPVQPGELWKLAQGQVTVALTRKPGRPDPGLIVLMESGEHAEELERGLLLLREALVDNQVKHERLRLEATDFVHVPHPRRPQRGLYIGQSKSLLIVTSTRELAEQVVQLHKQKPKVKSLKENAGFAQRNKAQFADAWAYAWLDFSLVMEVVADEIAKRRDPDAEPNPLVPQPERVMEALGLTGLKSVSLSAASDVDGGLLEMYLDVPKAQRRGLFELLATPEKDAGPLPFVASDVSSFGRWRQSGAHIWKTFIDTANEITPAAAGALAFFQASVQAKNPEFKLKAQLIDTLADDFIVIEQAPRGDDLQALLSPPRLYLVKSEQPKVTLGAMKDLVSMVVDTPPDSEEIEGRTVYSYQFGNFNNDEETAVHAVAVGEYVLISQDLKAVKDYLNGPKQGAKPLRALAGLKQAAEKVGGFESGAFGFENSRVMVGAIFSVLKENPNLISEALGDLPEGIDPETGLPVGGGRLSEWFDPKLLPDFRQISKYLHYTVTGATTTDAGIRFRLLMPTPPKLR